MTLETIENRPILKWLFVGTVFFGVAVMFAIFFMQLNTAGTSLGIDNIFYALKNGNIRYDVTNGLRNPPWSVLVLLPLGYLPGQAAWGVLVFATLAVLIFSVPQPQKKWVYWLLIFFLVTSFPTLRVIADAQLEVLVFGGILLIISGYKIENPYLLAGGILLATAKPQVVFALMLVLPFYVLKTWQMRNWLITAGLVLAVVIPTMIWRGSNWLEALQGTYQAGSIIDIGLNAALNRMEIFPQVIISLFLLSIAVISAYVLWRSDTRLSREKVGILLCASMLLAPYTAGNSVLNVLVVALIPLCIKRPLIGLIFFVLTDIFYFFNTPDFARVYAYYWTFYLLFAWAALCWFTINEDSEGLPETSL